MMTQNSTFVKHKKDNEQDSVWFYFLVANDSASAQCKECKKVLKTTGGSTKGLHTHLAAIHKTKITKAEVQIDEPPKKRKLTDFFNQIHENSLDALLARMTAKDGMPFSVFITSKDLRNLILAKGHANLPKSATTIRDIVMKYGEKVRSKIKVELNQIKNAGDRFSISFDEWTSNSNKRYINIHLYFVNKKWNLGLARVDKSLTAEVCVEALKKRLQIYDISLNTDIVAMVTDGPNVNLKIGKIVDLEHQICYAHIIHLAVCDVLYKNKDTLIAEDTVIEAENADDDAECLDLPIIYENSTEILNLTNEFQIKSIINNVRKIVKIFKNSPTKNDTILQKYVKESHGKELNLLLDCKTRWNSLLTMLERFVLLKDGIKKSLIDLNSLNEYDVDFDVLKEIIDVLHPIKLTVEALGRSDANLCTANAALKFLFKELNEKNTRLSKKMISTLEKRLGNRRQGELTDALNYLQNSNTNETTNSNMPDFFKKPAKKVIRNQIIKLIEKFYHAEEVEDDIIIVDTMETIEETLEQKLEKEIQNSMKTLGPKPSYKNLKETVKNEMNVFKGGTRGFFLEKAYKYLMTIPPTSIDAERAFSSAAYLNNKIRCRLADDTLDTLIFLRSYFRTESDSK